MFPLLLLLFSPSPPHSLQVIQNAEILSVFFWAVCCLPSVEGVCLCVCLILNI